MDYTACFSTTLGLFDLLLHLFYLIIRDSTCTLPASEMEFFMAVVNDVNLVTIAIDSSFLGVRNSLLLIIIIIIIILVDYYCYY